MDEFLTEFDAVFAEFARRAKPGRFEPNVDVALSADERTLLVTVEIAGADPSQLRVMVEHRYLYILGRRPDNDRAARGSYLMKEIDYGEFAKRIHLPMPVAYEDATAIYRDGMLTIRLPVSSDVPLPYNRTEIRMIVKRVPV
jgi:HSP20 family protein